MNSLNEVYLKELYSQLPVLYLRAVYVDNRSQAVRLSSTSAPVRHETGPDYVRDFNLKINAVHNQRVRNTVFAQKNSQHKRLSLCR
jgi:hypothetical protein